MVGGRWFYRSSGISLLGFHGRDYDAGDVAKPIFVNDEMPRAVFISSDKAKEDRSNLRVRKVRQRGGLRRDFYKLDYSRSW